MVFLDVIKSDMLQHVTLTSWEFMLTLRMDVETLLSLLLAWSVLLDAFLRLKALTGGVSLVMVDSQW